MYPSTHAQTDHYRHARPVLWLLLQYLPYSEPIQRKPQRGGAAEGRDTSFVMAAKGLYLCILVLNPNRLLRFKPSLIHGWLFLGNRGWGGGQHKLKQNYVLQKSFKSRRRVGEIGR